MFLFLVYTCELKFLGFFDKELILLQSDQIQKKKYHVVNRLNVFSNSYCIEVYKMFHKNMTR